MVPAWLICIHIAAATALIYKYLNGSSAFRQSTSVAKIKLFDLLSICLVKYDSPGLCSLQNVVSSFFHSLKKNMATFSPKVQWRRLLESLGIYVCVHAKSLQSCPTLCDPVYGLQPARLFCPWDSPGKNIGVGCHVLFHPGIDPVSLLSPALAGRFFTTNTTWEAPLYLNVSKCK